MSFVNTVERELIARGEGWWQRLCDAIPELRALEKTPQPPEYHAEGDVAVHTRLTIEACPPGCDPDLLWAAMLHDIGKPVTTATREDGRIIAHGHTKAGAVLAEAILQRLGMESLRREQIVWLVHQHMFHHSWQLQAGDRVSKKQRAVLLDERFPLLLELLRADSLGSQGRNRDLSRYEFYRQLFLEVMSEESGSPFS